MHTSDTRDLLPDNSPFVFQKSMTSTVFVDPLNPDSVKKILLEPINSCHYLIFQAIMLSNIPGVWLPDEIQIKHYPFTHVIVTSQKFSSSMDRVKFPLDINQRFNLALQIGTSLDRLRAKGISYFDIRPDNIAINNSHAYLFDFDKSNFYSLMNEAERYNETQNYIKLMESLALDLFSDEVIYYQERPPVYTFLVKYFSESLLSETLHKKSSSFVDIAELVFNNTKELL